MDHPFLRLLPPDAASLSALPPGSHPHLNQPVVLVDGRLWLLIATRRHPADGVMRALLLCPTKTIAAVCPAAMVSGYFHADLVMAQKEQPELSPPGGAPQPLSPVSLAELRLRRAAAVFSNEAPQDSEVVVAGGISFHRIPA